MEEFTELGVEQKAALERTAKMAKVFGIVLLTSVVLTLSSNILSVLFRGSAAFSIMSSFIGMAITVGFGLLLIFFAKHTKEYTLTNASSSLKKALHNLKWSFTMRGILYLVILGLTFLAFFIALLLGANGSF